MLSFLITIILGIAGNEIGLDRIEILVMVVTGVFISFVLLIDGFICKMAIRSHKNGHVWLSVVLMSVFFIGLGLIAIAVYVSTSFLGW